MSHKKIFSSNDILHQLFLDETPPTLYIDNINKKRLKNKKLNISRNIEIKKREIKNDCKTICGSNLNRLPSALKNFKKGMIHFYFDKDSDLIRKFPKIRHKMLLETQKKNQNLRGKINAGNLFFFYLSDRNSSNENRIKESNKIKLRNSQIFSFSQEKDSIVNEILKIQYNKNRKKYSMIFGRNNSGKSNMEMNGDNGFNTPRNIKKLILNMESNNNNNNNNINIINNNNINNNNNNIKLNYISHLNEYFT
jgi:hypothetical protein